MSQIDDVRHVDLVSNEPLAGQQHLLARVYGDEDDKLQIQAVCGNESQLRDYLRGLVQGAGNGVDDLTAFLQSLHDLIDATYVHASTPHHMDQCPFHDASTISIHAGAHTPVASAR